MKTTAQRWRRVAMALMLVLLCAPVWAIDGKIIKTDEKVLEGTIIYQPASKSYLVTTKGVTMTVSAQQVKQVIVKEPAGLAAAVDTVRKNQPAAAISVLEGILKDYQGLGWDLVAARWLAEAYLGMKNPTKAVEMCETLIKGNEKAAYEGEFARMYWRALLDAGQTDKLRRILGSAIESGNRETAAGAQIMRGDIEKKNADLKKALVDGYLRTVYLFESVKTVQPEALYKAAKCFEELGQHSYADKMRKRLLERYPSDPYSERMKSGT
jgi:hypothetical protein